MEHDEMTPQPESASQPQPRLRSRGPRRRRSRWPRLVLGLLMILLVLAGAGLAISNYLIYGTITPDVISHEAYVFGGTAKAFYVSSGGDNADLAYQPEQSEESLKERLSQIVAFAKEKGFTSIFFEARPSATAMYRTKYFPADRAITGEEGSFLVFDPLKYLAAEAAENSIELYAVVNTYYAGKRDSQRHSSNPVNDMMGSILGDGDELYFNPTAGDVQTLLGDSCLELATKYGLTGVILAGIDDPALTDVEGYDDAVSTLLRQLKAGISKTNDKVRLGVMLDAGADPATSVERAKTWAADTGIDLLVPPIMAGAGGSGEDYATMAGLWKSAVEGTGVRLIAANQVEAPKGTDAVSYHEELGYRLFVNSRIDAISGVVLESYSQLQADLGRTEELMSFLWDSNSPLPELETQTPQKLSIAYPTTGKDTSNNEKYYITGHSDPGQPLLLGEMEVERTTTDGTFGILVELEVGANTFTFHQGSETVTATITRTDPKQAALPISVLTQYSLFPTYDYGVKVGEELTLTCTGPSGGAVTASLGGLSVTLTQEKTGEAGGTPVTFTGKLTIPEDYPAKEVTKLGNVDYVLNYGGKNSSYRSAGQVYVAGADARLVLEVKDFLTPSYTEPTEYDTTVSVLKDGARDYWAGLEGARYKLESAGYVSASSVRIVEGTVDLASNVVDVRFESTPQAEVLTLVGTSPNAYKGETVDGNLVITLFNTHIDNPDFGFFTSALFDSVEVQNVEGHAVLTFKPVADSRFWGYDVSYDDNGYTVIYCKRAPAASTTFGRPLQGVSVVVDPGHDGGARDALENYDPGAIGVGGADGAYEARLNFAVASVLKYRLEQMGATVVMTRDNTDGFKASLQDRTQTAWQNKPDFFISVHHNSTDLSVDANRVTGTEVYYSTGFSRSFADNITTQFRDRAIRETRDPQDWAFFVTRNLFCPSVLVEVGYMSNPKEHQDCANTIVIFREACAIAQAVVDTLPANAVSTPLEAAAAPSEESSAPASQEDQTR